ncbi:MAG: hypothetical protein ACKO96_08970, partial [Flammeovirgaceae bacterium]
MKSSDEFVNSELSKFIHLFSTTFDESERIKAIDGIVLYGIKSGGKTQCSRILIELWYQCAWRDTQMQLLCAIGKTQELRGVEFLIR